MQTHILSETYEHTSPAGAEVRVLLGNSYGGAAHCTLKRGKVSKAVTHKTVSEIWHVIAGAGEIWRKAGDEACVTTLAPGVSIDIPLGTHFQYRASAEADLVFVCITTPPWSGADEARYVECGAWEPSA